MFGDIAATRDQQIERGIEYYCELREQQRRIAAQVAHLEGQTRFLCLQDSTYGQLTTGAVAGARDEAVELYEVAARVLGAKESDTRWIITPALALDGARPGDLLATPAGRARVRELLARLERGVYT